MALVVVDQTLMCDRL